MYVYYLFYTCLSFWLLRVQEKSNDLTWVMAQKECGTQPQDFSKIVDSWPYTTT